MSPAHDATAVDAWILLTVDGKTVVPPNGDFQPRPGVTVGPALS